MIVYEVNLFVRRDLEARMWRAQQAVGDEPHPSQPVPDLLAGAATVRP